MKKTLVTIYEDPITRETPEGQAVLLRKEFDMNDECECWLVRFVGGDTVERIVNRKDIRFAG